MIRRWPSLLLVLAAALGFAESRAGAVGLDPFRAAGSAASPSALSPFRVAQAEPSPAEPAAAATPTRSAAAATPATPRACQVDAECPNENICEEGVCHPIQVSTNILYLYYREGSFTEILGLYWSRRGSSGYKVLAPFWWHYWSPQSQFRAFAPFYWHSEDYARQSSTTVIVPGLPISWSHEPGARSLGVWPIFYASTRHGWALPLLGTFRVTDPEAQTSAGAVAFLYWWRRGPGRTFDLLIPLFATTSSPDSGFTFALPLNFAWRRGDEASILAVPFGYHHSSPSGETVYTLLGYFKRDRARTAGSVAWLYWFERNAGKQHASYDVLFPLVWDFRDSRSRMTIGFPLLWHFREGGDSTTIFFPLVWSFRSPNSSTMVAGPWVHVRRGDTRFDTVFPVWWSGSDRQSSFRALLPFVYWEKAAHGRRLTWVSPIGGYSRDDDLRSTTLALVPFFFHHRDPASSLLVLSPLYVSHRSFTTHASTRLISLLLYHRRDDAGSTSVLFPLWWRFRAEPSGAAASAFLGVYAHRRGPRDESTFAGLFPVLGLYWRKFTGGGWSAGLFPLAYFGENADREHGVVFPFYWHFRGQRSSTTVVAPFYYWHRDQDGHVGGAPLFLTFFGADRGDSYAVQFPLYWHFASQRLGTSTTATPFGYYHTDSDGWSLGVGPVLPLFYMRRGENRSHTVVFPLYWNFRDRAADTVTTVIGPYFHRTRGQEVTDGFFPLVYYRRGARPGGTPETSFTLFPLFHYRRDANSSLILTPLGASGQGPRRAAGFALLYFWYRDANFTAGLVPFLYADVTRKATGERTRQIGPWFQIDGPGYRSRLLFPFFGRYEDAREQDTFVFPSYFRQRKTDGTQIDALIPLYWRSSWGGRTTKVVGLWYDHTAPAAHHTGLFPIYFYARNAKTSTTVIPPLLGVRHRDFQSNRQWMTMLALFWHSSGPDSTSTTLFPVLWFSRQGPRSHTVFFPLFWRFADESRQAEYNLVGIFYWSSWGRGRTRGLMPLGWYTNDPDRGTSSGGLVPLFYGASGPNRFTFLTLLGGFHRTELLRYWYATPLVVFVNKVQSKFGMVAPFWFSHTDRVTEKTVTVVPPLAFVSVSQPDAGITTCCVLFWRHHDVSSSTTFGFPLYYDFHDYNISRTTLFLPFFAHYRRDSDQNSWWVGPLFYRHSTPTTSTTVAFPLYWDYKRGPDRTTVLFPFYAHWRRPGHASTYVFPTFYHREGLNKAGDPDGTWRTVVAPFYDAAVKRPGDFMWEVLGGLFGHERIGRNRYLRLFFMTFELEPQQRAASWYTQPPPTPRRKAPRSLSMNAW